MLENKVVRAAVFFLVAFGVPTVLGAITNDFNQGIHIGVVTGIIFAVISQFFKPAEKLKE